MWKLKHEKDIQLELMTFGDSVSLKDYINFTYDKLIVDKRENITEIDKLHELLITSLTYGVAEKDLNLVCHNCNNITPMTINVFDHITYKEGSTLVDENTPANEFIDNLNDGLSISFTCNCLSCRQLLHYKADPKEIFNNYIFYYDLITYYTMINFFKYHGYSTYEIGDMTYIEAKLLKSIIDEDQKQEDNQDY